MHDPRFQVPDILQTESCFPVSTNYVLNDGWLDPLIVSAGIKIPVLALCTFVSSYAVVKLISLLPGSKYVVG